MFNFSKENALPFDLWGLIYEGWKPTPTDGVTVFLQGLEKRGDNNLRKRIYFSAVTPDLYRPMYGNKVAAFFDQLMDAQYAHLHRTWVQALCYFRFEDTIRWTERMS